MRHALETRDGIPGIDDDLKRRWMARAVEHGRSIE
jgi:plasmid stability protein